MGRYIDWDDVVNRYRTISDRDSTEINTSFILYAEAEVDGRLATKYSVPFSSNNITAKDLAIDITYIKAGNLNIEETERLQKMVDDKFKRLLEGEEVMLLADGIALSADVGGTVYSTTQDYHPVFGLLSFS